MYSNVVYENLIIKQGLTNIDALTISYKYLYLDIENAIIVSYCIFVLQVVTYMPLKLQYSLF